jgi:protease-4
MRQSESDSENTRRVAAPEVLQIQCMGPKKKGLLGKIFTYLIVLIFIVSIVANFYMAALLKARFTSPFHAQVYQEGDEGQIVAVYEIAGTIGDDTAAQFSAFYRFVRDTPEIKAVVLRVNSPGGTIAASDRIYQLIGKMRTDLDRPVVVSQGAVAASGGYYISVPAQRIFAEKTTITGSIGVIAMYPAFKGMADKIGVEIITVRSRQAYRWKARPDGYERPEPRIMAEIQEMMDEFHADFTEVVKTSRPDIVETTEQVTITNATGQQQQIEEVAPYNGRIYRGPEAKARKMVDEIGTIEDAIDYAARAAQLKSPHVVRYRPFRSILAQMGLPVGEIQAGAKALENLTSPRILMLWKLD